MLDAFGSNAANIRKIENAERAAMGLPPLPPANPKKDAAKKCDKKKHPKGCAHLSAPKIQ